MKAKAERLLVVVDESSATKRALDYIGSLIDCRPAWICHYSYALPTAIASRIAGIRRRESPKREEKLQAEPHQDQQT